MISVLGEDDFAELVASFFEDAHSLLSQLERMDLLDASTRDHLLHTLKSGRQCRT